MDESYAPPTGPPPPKVPEGWKAIWNDQYKEWFYVNVHTKQSQWDKPEHPAIDPASQSGDPSHRNSSDAPPPTYTPGDNVPATAGTDTKSAHLQSNNPYAQNTKESDEEYARRLQEEENARSHGPGVGGGDQSRGANDSYYNNNSSQGYPTSPNYNSAQPQQQQQQASTDRGSSSKSGGFLNKIKQKLDDKSRQRPMGAPMMGYNAGGYPPQQQHYGGYPQQGYGGHPQQGYGRPMGGMPMGYGHPVKKKGGMGAGGAAALGVGGGLLGGMLIADGINDMQEDAYQDGYEDGGDFDGGDMGGDF